VTLLHKGEQFRADKISVDAAVANPKMRAVLNAEPVEIVGARFVTGVKWKDMHTGKEELITVEGVFVEIGLIPNTTWVGLPGQGNAIELNEMKQIKVDPKTHRTSHPRVWAAGDCTDGLYHQNNIAAGDAVKALEDIYMSLQKM
jgi:thioredoxin reductase